MWNSHTLFAAVITKKNRRKPEKPASVQKVSEKVFKTQVKWCNLGGGVIWPWKYGKFVAISEEICGKGGNEREAVLT